METTLKPSGGKKTKALGAMPRGESAFANKRTAQEHKLANKWAMWFMQRGDAARKSTERRRSEENPKPTDGESEHEPQPTKAEQKATYENSIKKIADFDSVESFWAVYERLLRPNDLGHTTDFHLFRDGVKPIWEDPANKRGGKWIIRLRKGFATTFWERLILYIIGEQFGETVGDEICGAVISVRYNEDILAVWNRNANNREALQRIRDGIASVLKLPDWVRIEYKSHDSAINDKSSFRNTSVWRGGRDGGGNRRGHHNQGHRGGAPPGRFGRDDRGGRFGRDGPDRYENHHRDGGYDDRDRDRDRPPRAFGGVGGGRRRGGRDRDRDYDGGRRGDYDDRDRDGGGRAPRAFGGNGRGGNSSSGFPRQRRDDDHRRGGDRRGHHDYHRGDGRGGRDGESRGGRDSNFARMPRGGSSGGSRPSDTGSWR